MEFFIYLIGIPIAYAVILNIVFRRKPDSYYVKKAVEEIKRKAS